MQSRRSGAFHRCLRFRPSADGQSGGPAGFDADGWNGILAPAGTLRNIILRKNQEINATLNAPELFDELMRSEAEKRGPVIKATGAKLDQGGQTI